MQYAQIKTPQVTYIYTICTSKNTTSNFYLYNIAQIKAPQVTYIYTIYLKTFIYTTSRSIKNKFLSTHDTLKKDV